MIRLMTLFTLLLSISAQAAIEDLYVHRDLAVSILNYDSGEEVEQHAQSNELGLFQEIREVSDWDTFAHMTSFTNVVIDGDTLELSGTFSGHIGNTATGEPRLAQSRAFTHIYFRVSATSSYHLEIANTTDDGVGCGVDIHRVGPEETLVDWSATGDASFEGPLLAGAEYIINIGLSTEHSSTEIYEDNIGFSVDFVVTPGPVAVEHTSLSLVKSLFR